MSMILSLVKAMGVMAGVLIITWLISIVFSYSELYALIAVVVALTALLWWVFYQMQNL